MANTLAYDVDYFTEAIQTAETLIRNLQKDESTKKLSAIHEFTEVPALPRDEESRQLKIYKEATKVYKDLYIAVARAIMSILDSSYAGIHDQEESYNYKPAKQPIEAAEAIKSLPNAYVGGPIKSAISSNNPFVQKIVIEYFESLPIDIRVSEIFPKDYNLYIKKLKPKVLSRIKDLS